MKTITMDFLDYMGEQAVREGLAGRVKDLEHAIRKVTGKPVEQVLMEVQASDDAAQEQDYISHLRRKHRL